MVRSSRRRFHFFRIEKNGNRNAAFRTLRERTRTVRTRLDALARTIPRARRGPRHRLRLPGAPSPPAALDGHARLPLPPPHARRSVLSAGAAGHHGARRFQRARARRHRRRTGGAGLRQPGAVPHQLRHHRSARRGESRGCKALPACRRRRAEAAFAVRNGRTVQGAGDRKGRRGISAWVSSEGTAVARFSLFLFLVLFSTGTRAEKPWQDSPHGPMLECIIPPGFTAAMLPEPKSRGAELTLRYCVQCHNLANPAMHDAARWPSVVRRMVPRMEGKGNMGKLMSEIDGRRRIAQSRGRPRYHRLPAQARAARTRSEENTPRSTRPPANPSGLPAASATCCPTRAAIPPPSGLPWWRAWRRTWSG